MARLTYVSRHRTETPQKEGHGWEDGCRPEDWRKPVIQLMEERLFGDSSVEHDPDLENLLRLSVANFSDGVNTGYYINTYTTKQCPTMGGVLEELRLGLERLQHQRELEAMQQSHVVERGNLQLLRF